MKILNFGSINIDMVFSVPHIVLPGETIASVGFIRNAGGKGANQSAALAKAGLSVHHAGKIGDDGRWILELLQSYGVCTDYIIVGDDPTGQALIQVSSQGENAIVLFPGGNHQITESDIDAVLAHFSKGDILLLQNEINNLNYLMRQALSKQMNIWFNPAPFDEGVRALPIDKVKMLIVNEIEAARLAQLPLQSEYFTILESLTAKFPNIEIILTAGKEGAFYGCGDKRKKCAAFTVPVVDTTAAGDTFIGYLMAARLRGCSITSSLAYACKASSIKVSRLGAMQGIPSAHEVFTE
ncbi:MAG: ribokinase [Sphaerochaetaceae bacterium]|jgi:ribokinase|nr:ribokinase [Sphaerochaetaceae bacterium]NLO61185.1 ribokinase [Spirochaetales bacterium]MDD4259451.1 ribokinase [Sphaerochaetaceae bacterium]MDD4762449.1 ribokinase [Sphaerochaetaceae bacterium]MDD4840640.1 ribokinase [Sphaerochaetaceae bacterium]